MTTAKQKAAEAKRKEQAQKSVDPRSSGTTERPPNTTGLGKPDASDDDDEPQPRTRKKPDPIVTAIVPRSYMLVIAHGSEFRYEAGIQDMPLSHAEHQWSVDNGVEIKK